MKQLYALSLVLGLLFGRSEFASAQTSPLPDVYISEVAWSGSAPSTADEWLEITNRSRETVDLGGWIVDGAATSGGAIQIAPVTLLASGATLLIANYDAGNPKSTLTIAPQLVTTSVSLANSGLSLRLIDSHGIVIDTLAFGSSPSAGGSNPYRSAVRLENGELQSAEISTNLSLATQFGTPGIIDINWSKTEPDIQSPTQTEPTIEVLSDNTVTTTPVSTEPVQTLELPIISVPLLTTEDLTIPVIEPATESTPEIVTVIDLSNQKEVQLSEFMPNPLDGIEWVELANPSAETITLDGMYVTDASGSKTPLAGTLEEAEFSLVQSPKGKLNNDGDTLTLFTTGGDATDSITYGTELLELPNKGESIGRIENEWTILETATPGELNQANIVAQIPTEEIIEPNLAEPEVIEEIEAPEVLMAPAEHMLPQTVTVVSIAEKPSKTKSTTHASKREKANEQSVITGIITVPPGNFGKQIAYMEGYQLYMHSSKWPELQVGDEVQVSGSLTTSNGEPRLKLKDESSILVKNHAQVSVQAFRSSMLKAEYAGFEVRFEGTIADRTKKSLELEMEDSQVTLHLPKEVNGLLLAQDTLAGNAVIRAGKQGFFLEALSKDALEIRATDPAPTQSQAHTNHSSPKSMAGAGLATGTLGALGYWLRKYLMLA